MDVILFETSSTSAANDIVAAVQAGSLWGIDMGTTSKASSYSNFVAVQATATRVGNIMSAAPENVSIDVQYHDLYSFTDSTPDEKLWYLLGAM